MEELAVKLAEVDARSKSNTKRIDKLEDEQSAIHSIATSVAVMATEQKTMSEKITNIDCKVDKLENIPVSRWNGLVDKIIFAIAGGLIAWILTQILK